MNLTDQQIQRYNRQIVMKEIGAEGQERLLAAKVLVVGAGGLGSPSAFYLAAAGVGVIGIIDPETVDLSNLQRQILHATEDVDRPKVESARDTLTALNPDIRVAIYHERLTAGNACSIFEGYDVIVDACDNFETRYTANDACVILGKPFVHGSVLAFEGQVTVFGLRDGPCYRCQYPETPPPEIVQGYQEAGVLGTVPGIIGSVQAAETIKLLLGKGVSLAGRLVHFDALGMRFRTFTIHRDPACPVCGEHPTITELVDR